MKGERYKQQPPPTPILSCLWCFLFGYRGDSRPAGAEGFRPSDKSGSDPCLPGHKKYTTRLEELQ